MSERETGVTSHEADMKKWDEVLVRLDRAVLKAMAKAPSREAVFQTVMYGVLFAMLMYDVRLAAAFTLPLMVLSYISEVVMRIFVSDRFAGLYDQMMHPNSVFLWPLVWHIWLVVMLLAVVL